MATMQFFGAAGTVTGSCYLIESEGRNILVDAGMFQGKEEIAKLNAQPLGFNPSKIEGMVLTHAHLDHSGRLPLLIQQGYRAPIYMTAATLDLIEIALYDMLQVQNFDGDSYFQYTPEDVEMVLTLAQVVDYHTPFQVGTWEASLVNAGHILGSASVLLDDKHLGGRLVMSGDLGNSPQALEQPTEQVSMGTWVVMESTYGGRYHPDEDPAAVLTQAVRHVLDRQGTLLIPAFSIERSQELLHLFGHLKAEGRLPKELPIYLDSPMAIRTTRLYGKHKGLASNEIKSHSNDPYDFPELKVAMKRRESEKISRDPQAKVIIAGSGMMMGGRIVRHARRFLSDERNAILFVGYQGEETLGREILEGAEVVTIDEEAVTVAAEVMRMSALSSHADEGQLLSWLGAIEGVKQVILTHGEDEARVALAEAVAKQTGLEAMNITQPQLGEHLTLTTA